MTGRSRSIRPTAGEAIGRSVERPRGAPTRPRCEALAEATRRRRQPRLRRRARHRCQRSLGHRGRARRAPAPARSGPRRRPAASRLGFPEGHPNFRGVLPPAIGPVGQTLEGHDLILVAGSSVFPYYPHIPGPLLPEGASLVAITSDPDEAARAPMGDALVADVGAHPGGAAGGGPEIASRPQPEPNPGPGEIPTSDPLNPSTVALRRSPRSSPRTDRRPRVALQHPGAAQSAAHLAPGQLLLQRRRRPRLRPRRVGRRPARPARPTGRLRARRGLGPVRDHRLLERRRLHGTGHLPASCATPSTRSSSGSPRSSGCTARPGSTCRRSTSPRSPRATASGPTGPATAIRSRRRWPKRSPPPSPELVEVPVAPGNGALLGGEMALLRQSLTSLAPPESSRLPIAPPTRSPPGSAQPLRGELEALLGADRVLASAGDIIRYASDASPYRLLPRAVVMAQERRRHRQGARLTGAARGSRSPSAPAAPASTGRARATGILVDVRRHFGGVAVEGDGALARVKPGTVLGHANRVLAPHGRKLGPDPASTEIATRRRRDRQQLGRDALRRRPTTPTRPCAR